MKDFDGLLKNSSNINKGKTLLTEDLEMYIIELVKVTIILFLTHIGKLIYFKAKLIYNLYNHKWRVNNETYHLHSNFFSFLHMYGSSNYETWFMGNEIRNAKF